MGEFSKKFSLEGKVALVTGASYGIGFAIACAYAEAGATVFNDIKQELVDKGLKAYEEKGIKAHGYVCDVTDEEAVNAFVAQVEKEVGVIDILVNNAGIIKRIPMCEMSAAEFRQVVDEALGKSLVYLTEDLHFLVPFGEKHISYPPKSFNGKRHLLYAKRANDVEINTYRNLAENVNDQHGDTHCYPHATANVETRGESVFAARNAIDGVVANHCHGEWPYASWGINRQDDACLKLDFGRPVEIDKLVIYERADFPHDNWWERITVEYSDGESCKYNLVKTDQGQEIKLEKKTIEWLLLKELIKADDPSPFPALTQIEVYGKDV